MKKLKYLSIIITPMLILGLFTLISLNKIPEKIYMNENAETCDLTLTDNLLIKSSDLYKDKLELKLLGLVSLKSVEVSKVKDLEVYPGGTNVGIKLTTKGVLVVGHSEVKSEGGKVQSPAKNSGIELGDVIIRVNGEDIENSKDLSKKLKGLESSKVSVDYVRDGASQTKEVNLLKEENDYKLGLWVRDSTAGIGTLTFYDKNTSKFGALGHPITDGDTNKPFTVKDGDILSSSIISVKKGEKGSPGELKGLFVNEKETLAKINKNTQSGIFGDTLQDLINTNFDKPMKVGFRNEMKEGAAKIITTIDENGPKMYDVQIIKLLKQDEPGPKSMIVKITDKELLEKTGGIVQGMSGSPIIQDDKLVGAITHVLINKPDVGYGIYIEWMLKDAGIIE